MDSAKLRHTHTHTHTRARPGAPPNATKVLLLQTSLRACVMFFFDFIEEALRIPSCPPTGRAAGGPEEDPDVLQMSSSWHRLTPLPAHGASLLQVLSVGGVLNGGS